MKVAVLVPYRPSTPERAANADVVFAHMEATGWPVHPVDDGGHPFSRAGSINHGVRESDAEVFVVPDADVLIPHDQLAHAIQLAAEPGVVQPFDRYLYLTRGQSAGIVASGVWPDAPEVEWDSGPTSKIPLVGACNVFSRVTWEATGGLLELRGWGCQDVIWWAMCNTFAAPTRRVAGPLMHLWHPHDDDTRRSRAENPELRHRSEVMGRFVGMVGDRAAMRAELERMGHALPPA